MTKLGARLVGDWGSRVRGAGLMFWRLWSQICQRTKARVFVQRERGWHAVEDIVKRAGDSGRSVQTVDRSQEGDAVVSFPIDLVRI
jgi:hypothetical protein